MHLQLILSKMIQQWENISFERIFNCNYNYLSHSKFPSRLSNFQIIYNRTFYVTGWYYHSYKNHWSTRSSIVLAIYVALLETYIINLHSMQLTRELGWLESSDFFKTSQICTDPQSKYWIISILPQFRFCKLRPPHEWKQLSLYFPVYL